MRLLIPLIILLAITSNAQAQQETLMRQNPLPGVSYSVVSEGRDRVVVDLTLNNKQIVADINYADHALHIQGVSGETGQLTALTQTDLATLSALQRGLQPRSSRVDNVLARTLLLLSNYPPGEAVDLKTNASIQQAWTSLCNQIGDSIAGTYTLRGKRQVMETAVLGPCGSGGCLGRCGPGCDSPPASSVQVFTQECFNHDLCAGATGQSFGRCKDEWLAAAPGFLFAPDCAVVTGVWNDNYGFTWTLSESDLIGAIFGTVDTTQYGMWDAWGLRTGFDMSLTATNPPPIESGSCTAFTYTGHAYCNSGSGTWTNECGLNGSWSMSRQGAAAATATVTASTTGFTPASKK